MLHEVVLVLVGAAVSGLLGATAWIWQRAVARKDDRRAFLRSRMEDRDEGFAMFLAACDALHFMKARGYLSGEMTEDDSPLATQTLVLWEDGIDKVRANVGDPAPFQAILKYAHWVLLADHPPVQAPGVDEFNQIGNLVVQCKRVYQEEQKHLTDKNPQDLGDAHEFKELLRLTKKSGTQLLVTEKGEYIAQLDGDSMIEWIRGESARKEKWAANRRVTLERMRRSGFFRDLPSA